MPARNGLVPGVLAAVCAMAVGLTATGCGGTPAASRTTGARSTSTSARTPAARRVSLRGIERALLYGHGGPPRPTAAACRRETAAERDAAPFGHTSRPVFSCVLTVTGERARYDVQVLPNGCYVAERRRSGRAVYGCR